MNEIKVKFIGKDGWGRKLWKNIENGRTYADVGKRELHTTSRDGEPDCPLRSDLVINFECSKCGEFKPEGDYCGFFEEGSFTCYECLEK